MNVAFVTMTNKKENNKNTKILSRPSPSPLIPIPIGTGADTKVLWATTTTHRITFKHVGVL